jgi:hypothetical protein
MRSSTERNQRLDRTPRSSGDSGSSVSVEEEEGPPPDGIAESTEPDTPETKSESHPLADTFVEMVVTLRAGELDTGTLRLEGWW